MKPSGGQQDEGSSAQAGEEGGVPAGAASMQPQVQGVGEAGGHDARGGHEESALRGVIEQMGGHDRPGPDQVLDFDRE